MISIFLTFERSWLRLHTEDQNSVYVIVLMIFHNSHRMSDCRVLTCDLTLLSRNAVVLVVYTMWSPVTQRVIICFFFCLFLARQPQVGQGLLIHEVSRPHTTTHHSRYDSYGRVISSSQRPLPNNTQHSQQTNVHARGGIRSHNPSRRAAADLHII